MTALHVRRAACALLAIATVWGVSAAPAPVPSRWVRVDYGALLDGRALTHSGEPVGLALSRLSGRPMPPPGERPEDAQLHRLIDPILEPYAFVLTDALDTLTAAPNPPMVEVGALWDTGDAQPAWVELVRARRFVLESDGEGHLRACLPAPSLDEDPATTAQKAWEQAWPVLRHALAAERRRLGRLKGGVELPSLDIEVHAYRHRPAVSTFDLGVPAWRTVVRDTGPRGDRVPLDLAGLQAILDRGLTLEGARLSPSGRVRWFTSEAETKPTILGRAPTLADVAVAYRAIAYGGIGEPYMSLDRAAAPHIANVNYGGRLRDTALGLVSLLSDVRFKTFSLGIDLLGSGDVRESVRRTLPEFRTHLERFASDPSAGTILNQQTRFWFYPDDVDLTLSEQGDVLAFRKVRMSAASERVKAADGATADPAWTKDTVAYINTHYDVLASLFPEMADLDESVRLLALFTWLEDAKTRGLAVPDLDVLLAEELPALPTPRRFPELLSHDVLPPPGTAGIVDVLDRTSVGEALDRLEPRGGASLPAGRRFARDLALLNPQVADQAELAKDMAALKANATDFERDAFCYRAERLLMHQRVLATITDKRRAEADERRKQAPKTRVFSVGIGGIDLGLTAVLARAAHRGGRLGLSASDRAATGEQRAERDGAKGPAAAPVDPAGLPALLWPDHGLGPVAGRMATALPDDAGTIVATRRLGSFVRQGTWKSRGSTPAGWDEYTLAMEGPEARFRRRIGDASLAPPLFQRVEGGRFLSYRLVRAGEVLKATPEISSIPDSAFAVAKLETSPPTEAPQLTLMDLPPPSGERVADDRAEPPTVTVRLRGAAGRERTAAIPRSLLQRLVRGRELDLSPEKPLQAFTPAADFLGASKALMVLQSPDELRSPWSGPIPARSGEEDAARLATALTRWWSAEEKETARAVVGVDALASSARWAKAPPLDGTIAVLSQGSTLPAQAEAMNAGLQGLSSSGEGARVVMVVSAESPGVMGRRLRVLATDPELAGKTLVAVCLGGPLRADLPASLLGEGKIAAFGLYEGGAVGFRSAIAEVAAWAKTAGSEASKGKRAEELAGPFTWFY